MTCCPRASPEGPRCGSGCGFWSSRHRIHRIRWLSSDDPLRRPPRTCSRFEWARRTKRRVLHRPPSSARPSHRWRRLRFRQPQVRPSRAARQVDSDRPTIAAAVTPIRNSAIAEASLKHDAAGQRDSAAGGPSPGEVCRQTVSQPFRQRSISTLASSRMSNPARVLAIDLVKPQRTADRRWAQWRSCTGGQRNPAAMAKRQSRRIVASSITGAGRSRAARLVAVTSKSGSSRQ